MVDQLIKNTFENTYRDDYSDSAGFHRVLFNNGRAVQARELTQLQTIIQSEITRFGNNIFKEGAAVNPGGISVNPIEFVKLNTASNTLPTDTSTIIGTEFTGATSGIKATIVDVKVAVGSDPATIYVKYNDGLSSGASIKFSPAEDIANGSVTLTVQTTNTTLNPATGRGLSGNVAGGDFYATGRFVYAPKQTSIISKYTSLLTDDLGFKIVEDVVTANDDATLYDNSGALPNTSSPGADRYRIRLTLDIRSNVDSDENFVYIAKIRNGIIVSDVKAESEDNYNILRDTLALRTSEESGDYIVKPFLLSFDDNDSDATQLDMKVSPGTAYVDGYRVNKDFNETLTIQKPRTTATLNNEVASFGLGNYVIVSANKGLPNVNEFQLMNLRTATAHGGSTIGTARVRAVEEHTGGNYKVFLFQINMNSGQNFRDVKSIGTSTTNYFDLVLELSKAVLKEAGNNSLLIPLPNKRPSSLSDISLATMRRFTTTTNGSGQATLTLSATGETFTNTNDWILALDDSDVISGATITGSGTTSASLSGLPASASNLEVLGYVNKSAATVRSKSLETGADTIASFDSDGAGLIYANLSKADIYSFDAITLSDSSGRSLVSNFTIDNGQRDNFYDLGRIILKPGQSVPADDVVVQYQYFDHGVSGDFFAVNSYSGEVSYENIPSHTLTDGTVVPLRDVIDFRPVVNSSQTFGAGAIINELPQTNNLVQSDITYYLGVKGKLVIDVANQFTFISGKPAINPEFPEVPKNSLELYRISLNPYILSPSDLTLRKIDHRNYKMADIGRLEDRIDKLEELTSLSLLELDTNSLSVLDSAGLNRTKSGFFVDNFVDHTFSNTASVEYRAALDPLNKALRPTSKEDAIGLVYDSSQSSNTILKGDNVYLKYDHKVLFNQSSVTGTENVNPFVRMDWTGNIQLSPSSDTWMETEYTGDRVINGGSRLDTNSANLWNSASWNWGGTPLDQLQVGSATNQVVLSSSSNTTGSSSSSTTGFITTTTSFETTTSSTTTGTNRIVSEETVREVVGDRVVDILVIPFMRSRKVYFKAEGFRPNTRLFPFFDGVSVDDWVRAETFVNISSNPEDFGNSQNNASGHPDGASTLVTDGTGKVEGTFFIPSLAGLRFRTGSRPFSLSDVTSGIKENGTSFGETVFTSKGTIEIRQRSILSTRVLNVQSFTNTTTSSNTRTTGSSSVDNTPPPPPPVVIPAPPAPVVPIRIPGSGRDPDPLAQSFFISQPTGVFTTKFDFYFKAKPSSQSNPVWIQLRTMENGIPTGEIIPGSTVFKYPSEITVSDDASAVATFEFDEPVYLQPYKEYAVVMLANTTDYLVYTSKVGDFELGTTDKKVTKQPFLGSLFKSQNASTWTPTQWEDLTFKMYTAKFTVSTGVARLENVAMPSELLTADPMSVDSADATITTYQPNHGFTVGDTVNISGATTFGGISTSSINGARTITAIDGNGYTFEADSASTSADIGGGSAVLSDKNILMDVMIPSVSMLVIDQTTTAATGQFTTAESLAGTETAYQKQSAIDIQINREFVFDSPRLIANASNETDNMAGAKSLSLDITLHSTNDYVSPVIDMQRATIIAISNRIDKQAASPASGFNVPLNYVAETNSSNGSHLSKHITKPISLAQDAVGLKVLVSANRPSAASFDIYYRTSNGDTLLENTDWSLATIETSMPSDENINVFRSYEYLIGGAGGSIPSFTQFQLKIVFKSTNSSKVPVIRDLRAIALGI